MRWIQRSILGLIGCLMVIGVRNVAGAGDSSAPYIYYYANTINALVVERADGTDSRVIAPGAMPEWNEVIEDLAWSVSGEWMAWRSRTYSGDGGATLTYGWAARSDGTNRLTLLDNFSPVGALHWSPNKDFLFVSYGVQADIIRFMIIHVKANTIIAQTQFENERFGTYLDGPESGWLADGSGVYFSLYFEKAILLGQLSVTNAVSVRIFTPWYKQDALVNITKGWLLSYDFGYYDSWRATLTMQDLSGDKTVSIDSLALDTIEHNQQSFRVEWNPTMRYALIYYWSCLPEYPCYNAISSQVYLLDWDAGKLQFLADRINPRGNAYEYIFDYPASAIWSPDGRYAVLRDERRRLIVVDAEQGYVQPSLDVPDAIAWQWAEKAHTLIVVSNVEKRLYQYDLQTKRLTGLDLYNPFFSVSPDSRFMGFWRYTTDYTMLDLRTRTKLRWAHHTRAAGPIVSYLWDEGSQWFMTGDYTTLAGGGSGESAVTLHNTALTVRRELSVCGYLSTCAGFVPDRVVPHLGEGSTTSVIPEPIYTLQNEGSPAWGPDGTMLASFNGSLNIWDMRGTPQRLASYQTNLSSPSITWNPDGREVILRTAYIENPCSGVEETWNIESGRRIAAHHLKCWQPTDKDPTQVILSPDRNFAVYARSFLSDLTIVDTHTHQTVATFSLEQARRIVWADDSQMLFVVNTSGTIMIWENGVIRTINEHASFGVVSVAIDTNRKIIFAAGALRRIHLWDAITGEQLTDVNWYADSISLSPDGTRLAAAGSSLVTIWDVSDLSKKGQ